MPCRISGTVEEEPGAKLEPIPSAPVPSDRRSALRHALGTARCENRRIVAKSDSGAIRRGRGRANERERVEHLGAFLVESRRYPDELTGAGIGVISRDEGKSRSTSLAFLGPFYEDSRVFPTLR